MLEAGEEPQERRGRRGGGRAGNLRRATSGTIRQLPWTLPENHDRPIEPLDAEGVQRIHDGAMRILEEIGILFLNEEALAVLKDAGCDVDMETQRVRMDRAFVMEQVRKAPKRFTITPRNPARRVDGRRRRDALRQCRRVRPTPWTSTAAGGRATVPVSAIS